MLLTNVYIYGDIASIPEISTDASHISYECCAAEYPSINAIKNKLLSVSVIVARGYKFLYFFKK